MTATNPGARAAPEPAQTGAAGTLSGIAAEAETPCAGNVVASGWQPIDTAPRDGACILGWCGTHWRALPRGPSGEP